jgi:hypothetical protein
MVELGLVRCFDFLKQLAPLMVGAAIFAPRVSGHPQMSGSIDQTTLSFLDHRLERLR